MDWDLLSSLLRWPSFSLSRIAYLVRYTLNNMLVSLKRLRKIPYYEQMPEMVEFVTMAHCAAMKTIVSRSKLMLAIVTTTSCEFYTNILLWCHNHNQKRPPYTFLPVHIVVMSFIIRTVYGRRENWPDCLFARGRALYQRIAQSHTIDVRLICWSVTE